MRKQVAEQEATLRVFVTIPGRKERRLFVVSGGIDLDELRRRSCQAWGVGSAYGSAIVCSVGSSRTRVLIATTDQWNDALEELVFEDGGPLEIELCFPQEPSMEE